MSKPASTGNCGSNILAQRYAQQAQRYFERHLYASLPAWPVPDPDLDIVVVIPALAEPDIATTLESVAGGRQPNCAVEVIVVINAATDAGAETRRLNAAALATVRDWAARNDGNKLRCLALDQRALRPDHAGVGLARKLGLDAGLARLVATRSGRGVLACLDADCRVSASYLAAIEQCFAVSDDIIAATVDFEHPLDEASPRLRQAIIDYELHLRCYRHGLQAAGSPYARYTVGSTIAVRSEIYAQEGGMNRRAAGEDFYFLNKLLKRGAVAVVDTATVFPAARLSDRVPFGTGAALRKSVDEPITTYAPAVYRELGDFLRGVEGCVVDGQAAPAIYADFLDTMGFDAWLAKTRANVASDAALSGQLQRWLDGFRLMKFVNWATAERYPRVAVAAAAREVASWYCADPATGAEALLYQFREFDRGLHSTRSP